jgi:hypothetical protein
MLETRLTKMVDRVHQLVQDIHDKKVVCKIAPNVNSASVRWTPGCARKKPLEVSSVPFTIAGLAKLLKEPVERVSVAFLILEMYEQGLLTDELILAHGVNLIKTRYSVGKLRKFLLDLRAEQQVLHRIMKTKPKLYRFDIHAG